MTEDNEKDVPPGEPDIRNRGLPKEDKIMFGIGLFLICAIGMALTLLVGWVLEIVGVTIGAADSGVGFRSAFIAAIIISVVVMVLFATVAGDGVVGELGIMVVGFFIMVIFFTISIAVVL